MNKIIIISEEQNERISKMKFEKDNILLPFEGVINDKKVFYLPSDILENNIFESVIKELEICEIKEVESIENKFHDPETKTEIFPSKESFQVDGKAVEITKYIFDGVEKIPLQLSVKTILNVKPELTLLDKIGKGIVDGATYVWNGVVYVWDSIIGWFKK